MERQTSDEHTSARLLHHQHTMRRWPWRALQRWQQVHQGLIVDLQVGQVHIEGMLGPYLHLLKHLNTVLEIKKNPYLLCTMEHFQKGKNIHIWSELPPEEPEEWCLSVCMTLWIQSWYRSFLPLSAQNTSQCLKNTQQKTYYGTENLPTYYTIILYTLYNVSCR